MRAMRVPVLKLRFRAHPGQARCRSAASFGLFDAKARNPPMYGPGVLRSRAPLFPHRTSNRSLSMSNPVSGTLKRKLKNSQQRPTAANHGSRTRKSGHCRPKTRGGRPAGRNVGGSRTTGNHPWRLDWLADDAVLIGTVSGSNSLLSGKSAGIFADLWCKGRISRRF
jgi:hypothetical protein